jgi:hypothetical protein
MRLRTSLLLLVVVALVALGAALPHTHIAPGLYNAEHDLTLLAVGGTIGPLPVVTLLFVFVVTAWLALAIPPSSVSVVVRDAESRAPPA